MLPRIARITFRVMSEQQTIVSTIKRRIHVSDDPLYLTTGQVRERYHVSDMWIWRAMHRVDHPFPQPIRFGGVKCARRWRLADIEAWEAEWEPAPRSES